MILNHIIAELGQLRSQVFTAADDPFAPAVISLRAKYDLKVEELMHKLMGFHVTALTPVQRDEVHDAMASRTNLGPLFDNTLSAYRYLRDAKANRKTDSSWRVIYARDLDHAIDQYEATNPARGSIITVDRFERLDSTGRWVQA